MRLKRIISGMGNLIRVDGDTSVDIRGITTNSKIAREGDMFFALKGTRLDGAMFIDEAVDRGAVAIVVDKDVKIFRKGICFIYVDDTTRAIAEACKVFYGNISERMRLIGITGTNGKTTTTYLIESLFNVIGEQAGVIGTVNYRFANRVIPAVNTTPGIMDIYLYLSDMYKEKIKNCIMEVSSHSLHQGRLGDMEFDIAVFTNLTREHLDYHKTMDNYLRSKLILFEKIKRHGYAIINRDEDVADKIIENVRRREDIDIITYGINCESDVMAKDINFSINGLDCIVEYGISRWPHTLQTNLEDGDSGIRINSPLIGRHNVYNILAAVAVGLTMGIGADSIKTGIAQAKPPPGRLERIDSGKGFFVYVDYAHTEDGLKNVLETLRGLRPARLICVFGCGGERDRLKRPAMGRIAGELCDKVFITSDNPRSEEPMDIIKEIVKGIIPGRENYIIEPDRFNAIRMALGQAREGDIILVAGKGHERYQIFKDTVLPFDDREVVQKILKRG